MSCAGRGVRLRVGVGRSVWLLKCEGRFLRSTRPPWLAGEQKHLGGWLIQRSVSLRGSEGSEQPLSEQTLSQVRGGGLALTDSSAGLEFREGAVGKNSSQIRCQIKRDEHVSFTAATPPRSSSEATRLPCRERRRSPHPGLWASNLRHLRQAPGGNSAPACMQDLPRPIAGLGCPGEHP